MKRNALWCVVGVLGLAGFGFAGGVAETNVVAEQVHAIPRSGWSDRDPGLLLVIVVDEDGLALEGVEVRLYGTKTPTLPMRSTKDGHVLLRMAEVGRLTVRASGEGLVTAEARQVVVKRGGLTVVALPMAKAAED